MNKYFTGAWIAPPTKNIDGAQNPDFMTLKQYRHLKDSGIDIIYGLYENARDDIKLVLKALDLASQVGMKYFVRDSRILESSNEAELLQNLKPYIDHGACAGVLVIDEPGLIHFEKIGLLQNMFDKYYKNKMFYTNLLPLHANSNQFYNGAFGGNLDGGDIHFETYYKKYLEQTNPRFLSYDLYPFENEYPNIRDDYFTQHSYIKNLCQNYKIPYYNFIQTCSFNHHIRIPTKQEINFQVFTSLAYGVTGIQYFTYFIPIEKTHEVFKGSIIDAYGIKTKQYTIVKNINKKLKSYFKVLKDYTYKGIDFSQDTLHTYNTKDKYDLLSSQTKIDGSFLIGVFENETESILLIVNTNLVNTQKTLNLNLDMFGDIALFDNDQFIKIEHKQFKHIIKSGSSILIKLNKEK